MGKDVKEFGKMKRMKRGKGKNKRQIKERNGTIGEVLKKGKRKGKFQGEWKVKDRREHTFFMCQASWPNRCVCW